MILPNGTVLPHGLLGMKGYEASIAAFNQSYRNTGLKSGIVVASYAVTDPSNQNKLCTEYDVLTFEQFENKGSTSILYKNVLSSQGFGSIADFLEYTLRPKTIQTEPGPTTFSGQDGAIVLIRCLDNVGDKAIVVGSLIHPNRPTTITSTKPQLSGEYNGVNVQIANDGSVSLTFNGATDNQGNPTDSSQGVTIVSIAKDGTFQVMNSGVTFTLDKTAQNATLTTQKDIVLTATGNLTIMCVDATITASGTATVEGSVVNLGKNASDAVIKGDTFKKFFDIHTVATALGPSGPPIMPMPPTTLSTKVKTE